MAQAISQKVIYQIPAADKTIDAFYHMRNERRSFHLNRIIHSAAMDTGELLNPYQLMLQIQDSDFLYSLT